MNHDFGSVIDRDFPGTCNCSTLGIYDSSGATVAGTKHGPRISARYYVLTFFTHLLQFKGLKFSAPMDVAVSNEEMTFAAHLPGHGGAERNAFACGNPPARGVILNEIQKDHFPASTRAQKGCLPGRFEVRFQIYRPLFQLGRKFRNSLPAVVGPLNKSFPKQTKPSVNHGVLNSAWFNSGSISPLPTYRLKYSQGSG